MSKVIGKKYKEKEEINTMEKLIEQDNESSSDEYNDESISNIINSNKTEVNRSTERNYESHFRLTNINNSKRDQNNDEVESKIDTNWKKGKRRVRVRNIMDVEQQKRQKYFHEEMLVIYYATSLVLINKQQDALKAVSEYLQKRGISDLGSANLYKLYAVLLVLNKNKTNEDTMKAVKYFKKAGGLFYSVGCKKGLAL